MQRFRHIIVIIISLIIPFLLSSCSKEKPIENKTQGVIDEKDEKPSGNPKIEIQSENTQYSIEIIPTEADRTSTIKIIPKGFNLEDAKIEWLVNDNRDAETTFSTFNANRVRKGNKIQARVIVNDRVLYSNVIYIKNARPRLTKVKLLPEVFKPGDTLSIYAEAIDPDEDKVNIIYEWTKNGEPAGNESRIEGTVKRGDKISVRITPFDGEDYGKPIVLNREIGNMPPMIIEDKEFDFDGKIYTYQVKASDPDGDELTYSIETEMEGIEIDPDTGLITWEVPVDYTGSVPVTILVNDNHGGIAKQEITITILLEK